MPVKCGSLFRNLELLEIIPVNFLANEADAVTTTFPGPPMLGTHATNTVMYDTNKNVKCA